LPPLFHTTNPTTPSIQTIAAAWAFIEFGKIYQALLLAHKAAKNSKRLQKQFFNIGFQRHGQTHIVQQHSVFHPSYCNDWAENLYPLN